MFSCEADYSGLSMVCIVAVLDHAKGHDVSML